MPQLTRRSSTLGFAAGIIILSSYAHAADAVAKRVTVAPGVQLHVVEAGRAANKPTIVFIPGWSASAEIWDEQIRHWSQNYRVISFDPRSQGDSTKTSSGNTPEQRAADLHALLLAEHADHPLLVGWSQAVQDIAAYVSRYRTAKLAGIVLVDAAVSDGAKGIAARPKQAAAQFDRFVTYVRNQEQYLRGMFGFIISKPQPPDVVEHAITAAMKTPPSVGIAQLVADMFGSDLTPAFAKMNCPVLIIAAASSAELARQEAEAKLIAGAQFVRIEDSSHAVFLDQPEQFERALADLLKKVGTESNEARPPVQTKAPALRRSQLEDRTPVAFLADE